MPDGQPSRGQRSHFYEGPGRRRRPRAAFAGEADAHAAATRVYALTGRRYSAYPCVRSTCDAWHIRPCHLRPEDLARTA